MTGPAKNSGEKTGRFATGTDPRRGVGKKGRSGRHPEVYRDLCRRLLDNPKTQRSLSRILADDKHAHFASIYKHLAEHGYGKPVQPITGEDGAAIVVRVIREEVSLAGD